MATRKPASADEYLKKLERKVREPLVALMRAVQRELRVSAIWDPFEQEWYFRTAGGKVLPAPRPARRRDVRAS